MLSLCSPSRSGPEALSFRSQARSPLSGAAGLRPSLNLETEHCETCVGPPHFLPTHRALMQMYRGGGAPGVLRAQWWVG